jgi:hypothetical protein
VNGSCLEELIMDVERVCTGLCAFYAVNRDNLALPSIVRVL